MGKEEWGRWRNQPATRAFLQFLADQEAAWRDLAADLVISGAFDPVHPHEDRNPNVVRGKVLALKMLQEVNIEDIQGFYREQRGDQADEA